MDRRKEFDLEEHWKTFLKDFRIGNANFPPEALWFLRLAFFDGIGKMLDIGDEHMPKLLESEGVEVAKACADDIAVQLYAFWSEVQGKLASMYN